MEIPKKVHLLTKTTLLFIKFYFNRKIFVTIKESAENMTHTNNAPSYELVHTSEGFYQVTYYVLVRNKL